MSYYQTDSKILEEFSDDSITEAYNHGFVLTRLAKGEMIQTRSLRIDLEKFELNSENRRILSKNENLEVQILQLPLKNYDWRIHSYGKDFYTKKFGDGTMSASKIKDMFQNQETSNMSHALFFYNKISESQGNWEMKNENFNLIGICPVYSNNTIIHYAYPFYDLGIPKERSLGLAMMTKAIVWAKENNKKYIYLGTVNDKKAHYKLQFGGIEWWDTGNMTWNNNIGQLKSVTNIE